MQEKVKNAIDLLDKKMSFELVSEYGEAWQAVKTELIQRSDNSSSLSCLSCKREHCSRSNPTCMACLRFGGERTDWHEQA